MSQRVPYEKAIGGVTEPSDEALMRAYLDGKFEAFEELYRRHSGRVYAYLRKKLRNPEVTDEVFQAVFLKLHASREGFDFKYPFTQWLFVVTKTTWLDHCRKQGRQVPLADEPLDEDRVSQKDPEPALDPVKELEALSHVTAEQRQAIEMRVLDERSYAEIAARLGRTEDGVRQLVSRGLKRLRGLRSGA